MTSQPPHDAAPPSVAKTKAKRDAQRKFALRLPTFFVQRDEDGWWLKLPPSHADGEKNVWVGPFAYLEPTCLAIARRYACELAEKYTVWAGQNGVEPDGLKPTTRLHQSSEAPDDPSVF